MKNDAIEQPAVQSDAIAQARWLQTKAAGYLRFAVILSSYLLFYASDLPDLANDWFNYYGPFSYCAVIPIMSLYIVWKQRAVLAKLPVEPAPLALVFLIFAIGVGVMGKALGDSFVVRVSMVLTIGALVYLLLGKKLFRALLFPIAFLFLMIPWPYVLVKEVAYHLRITDAILAEAALRAMGVILHRDSYYLHLPDITLEVADLCSGISSVFALFALGTYYAYFLPLGPWTKLWVVASTVPFAAFINLLRIILTSALAYYVGPAALGYVVHELTGIITFFIALFLFIALSEYMQRRMIKSGGARKPKAPVAQTEVSQVTQKPAGIGSRGWAAFSAGCLALLAGVFLSARIDAANAIALPRDLNAIPQTLGNYTSTENRWKEPYSDPKAERELSRIYANGRNDQFEVYVGYRSYQRGDKRLASPKLVMLGTWNFVSLDAARIPVSAGAAIDGISMVIQNNTAKQVVLYWYQDGKQTIGGEVAHRLHQAKRLLLQNRTDSAVVRIATPVTDVESIDQAKSRLADLATRFYPELIAVLPQ